MSFPPKVVPISGSIPPLVLIQNYIQKRGLTPATLECGGVRVCATMDELFQILEYNRAVWAAKKAGYTCALYFPANGDPRSKYFRARLLRPKEPDPLAPVPDVQAFKGKYLGMPKANNVLYQLPPTILPYNREPHDVLLVEGALQAMRLGQEGIDAIAISGVDNFRISDKRSPIIPELITRAASESTKRFIIALDSDQAANSQTEVSINKMAIELMKYKKDHEIYVAFPPDGDDGGKWGWDDFLQARNLTVILDHLKQFARRWEDNPFIQKCIEWANRYILIESTGKLFDIHPHVFSEVDCNTADKTLAQGSLMMDPYAARVSMIYFNHKHYLNSPYALRASITDMMPNDHQVLVKDYQRDIHVVNTYRYDRIVEPKKGNTNWLDYLLDNFCRDSPSAREKILKLIAYKIQYPGKHLPLAIGLIGEQGAGKSLFARAIGICVGDFSDAKARLRDTDNSTWNGHLVREWMELDPVMDVETWKIMMRETYTVIRNLYVGPKTVPSRTLHIVTSNQIKQLVTKGDRIMIFAGYGRKIPNNIGKEIHDLIGTVEKPGPGIAALRYRLLKEVNTESVEDMDNRTEIQGDIIEASQSRAEDVISEILFHIDEEIEILSSFVLQGLLDKMNYKGSYMSLRKSVMTIGTPALKEGVKINSVRYKFCVLRNHEKWSKCTDIEEYRKQFELATRLLETGKKY